MHERRAHKHRGHNFERTAHFATIIEGEIARIALRVQVSPVRALRDEVAAGKRYVGLNTCLSANEGVGYVTHGTNARAKRGVLHLLNAVHRRTVWDDDAPHVARVHR